MRTTLRPDTHPGPELPLQGKAGLRIWAGFFLFIYFTPNRVTRQIRIPGFLRVACTLTGSSSSWPPSSSPSPGLIPRQGAVASHGGGGGGKELSVSPRETGKLVPSAKQFLEGRAASAWRTVWKTRAKGGLAGGREGRRGKKGKRSVRYPPPPFAPVPKGKKK